MNITPAIGIRGWMTEQELYFLAESAAKSKLILEAGSYCGRSTRAMADNSEGIIHAIDPWDGKYQIYKNPRDLAYMSYHENGDNTIYTIFYHNLLKHINTGRVVVNRMEFTDFRATSSPDMIFIDAIHEYDALKADVAHALKLMKSGLLCGHDYNDSWPGVIEAVNELFPKFDVCGTIWSVQI